MYIFLCIEMFLATLLYKIICLPININFKYIVFIVSFVIDCNVYQCLMKLWIYQSISISLKRFRWIHEYSQFWLVCFSLLGFIFIFAALQILVFFF